MKTFSLLLILCCLVIAKASAQDAIGSNNIEKKVLKLINDLPEIKRENARRQKVGVKHLLKAFIQNTPTKEKNYYSVSVGEDLGFQLRTYDWYTVNPKTFVVKYEDMIEGKTISLAEWRKRLKHKK
jgi:hypothetical protein